MAFRLTGLFGREKGDPHDVEREEVLRRLKAVAEIQEIRRRAYDLEAGDRIDEVLDRASARHGNVADVLSIAKREIDRLAERRDPQPPDGGPDEAPAEFAPSTGAGQDIPDDADDGAGATGDPLVPEEEPAAPAAPAAVADRLLQTPNETQPEAETNGDDAAVGPLPDEPGGADGTSVSIILVANEKGGTGKSTLAIHVAVGLLRHGYRVGCLDLDGRQGTLSRFLSYREREQHRAACPMPEHRTLTTASGSPDDEAREVADAVAGLSGNDFIVIDTPGFVGEGVRRAHASADILLTPVNDSFVDIDAIAQVDRTRREVLGPSRYCDMVMQQLERRRASGGKALDWVVVRNRLAHLEARSSRESLELLRLLAERMGFRFVFGIGERVIFRELHYRGLTVLDLPPDAPESTASWANARLEIEHLLEHLGVLAETSRALPERRLA